jgi:hypothetical protein
MIMDLAGVRMALAAYDAAETRHDRERAEKRLRRLLTVGLVRTMIAAIDDPARPGPQPDDPDEPDESFDPD